MSSTPSAATRHPYRWVVLVLAWAAFTMTAVDRATWGPASLAVSEHLGVALAGLGVFATGYYVGYVISNAAGDVLTDWLGPRLVIGCSLFLAGVFMVLFGETDSVALGIRSRRGSGSSPGATTRPESRSSRSGFPRRTAASPWASSSPRRRWGR